MADTAGSAAPANWQRGGFGLYLHWPYCTAKCPYCDFNSHVADRIDHEGWADAYLAELRRCAADTPGRVLSTLFFGGGTPSLMAPETVARIVAEARRLWPMGNDPEITLEANPGSVEAARFRAFRDAGVTRVSLGVQALDDDDLRALGRLHDAAAARAALAVARDVFDRVSIDLIYARQNQTCEMWRSELLRALDMGIDHLSLYQLTVEPGTAFWRRQAVGRLPGLPDAELAADLYELTQELCGAAGLPAYEVSNHARPGAESRHNLIYWRGGDWIGVGPGAHGRVEIGGRRMATETHLAPLRWRAAVTGGSGESLRRPVSPRDSAEEYLMMGLRLTEGIDRSRLDALGFALDAHRLDGLIADGLLDASDTRLRCTGRGRMLLNAVLQQLLAG